MRTLYLECNAGVSGDMLLGALSNLLDDPSDIKTMLESAGIPGIEVMVHPKEMNHIKGNKVEVLVHGQPEGHHHGHSHSHRSPAEVLDIEGRKLLVCFGGHLNSAAKYLEKISNYLTFEYFCIVSLQTVEYLSTNRDNCLKFSVTSKLYRAQR